MLRIIFTITIQQVFSTCSENIMSFVYIFFIQQMIFCMSEFAVKEYFELYYSTKYLQCEIACQRSAE